MAVFFTRRSSLSLEGKLESDLKDGDLRPRSYINNAKDESRIPSRYVRLPLLLPKPLVNALMNYSNVSCSVGRAFHRLKQVDALEYTVDR